MQNFADVSDAEVRSMKAPTLVLAGDRDVPTLEHTVELARLFPRAASSFLDAPAGD